MGQAKTVRVLFVTAGPTIWDREGRLSGSADLPLCEQGLNHASQDAAAQGHPWVCQVVFGPDQASHQVAETLAQASQGSPELREDEELAEVRLGLWEGMREREAEEKFSTAFGQWQGDPWSVSVPEGEELAEAQARVVEAIRRIVNKARRDSGAVVIVLRPIAATLVRLALCGEESEVDFWTALKAARAPLWVSLSRSHPWKVRQLA